MDMQATTSASQIIFAPSREPARGVKSVFLAGSTSPTDDRNWRESLIELLADQPFTIYNPQRPSWDETWLENISFEPYRTQVEWELDMQEVADMVVLYFHPATKAPVSLLELGLSARTGKVIVVCPEGYWKRGNVQIVCKRHGIEMVEDVLELKDAILARMTSTGRTGSCVDERREGKFFGN
ncbi:hypothetical protein GGS21DRAFT_130767 [Xylaria nigripes]|nr:hypothetical protein GGS21DRAFT_130767 [Xylaria nigripes]